MIARLLADAVVLLHFAVIVFIVAGGLLALRWPRAAWVHLPFAAWGVAIEVIGFICPLTPLENLFRRMAGQAGYSGGFVEHYIIPVVYPAGLTRSVQLILGGLVLVTNLAIYTWVVLKWRGQDSTLDT